MVIVGFIVINQFVVLFLRVDYLNLNTLSLKQPYSLANTPARAS
jgi:hypothetical protein